ncbi:MAG: hypothetical protein IID37_03745 [Planctomycetes bacterium]|nr:hypothetical protein [Planctomycetota bacterium]
MRYRDLDNWYPAVIRSKGAVKLKKTVWGQVNTHGTGHSTHDQLKSPMVRSTNERRNEISWLLVRFRD